MLTSSLRRGLVAGLVAGLLAGIFALVVGYAPMAEATRLEELAHHGHADDPAAADPDHHDDDHGHAHDDGDDDHGHAHDDDGDDDHGHAHHDGSATDDGDERRDAHLTAGASEGEGHAHEHMFERTTQQAMLPVATGLLGAALGGLFGLAFAGLRGRMRGPSEWAASLKLGAVGWGVTVLAPTLTFPANPPGVGGAGGVDERTLGYGIVIVVALVLAVGGWLGGELLRRRTALHATTRQVLVGSAVTLVALGLLAVLPRALPGDGFPAEVLWTFRLVALGTLTILWVGIAAGFGWAAERGTRREGRVAA